MTSRIRAVQGGTSASKTVSIVLFLIHLAQTDKTPTLTSIVSENMPHLRRGGMLDFKNIMVAHKYWDGLRWHKTNSTYTFETGSVIEFFGADEPEKLRGARRDRLFINEANNVTLDAFDQLEVRTKEFVFLDWNPTSADFWFYVDIEPNPKFDVEHIILTYKDNEALSPEIIASIESRRDNKSWFRVYGEGQIGELEGTIYKDWKIIDEIPHEARLERRGLDFGYTNDPTAAVDIYRFNGGYILDEVLFQKGMSNRAIADALNLLPKVLIIADSAEPKSIDELTSYGLNVVGAMKGPGSVLAGIQFVQDQRISVTKRSLNLIKAFRNYSWRTDREGRVINEPDHAFSDIMDAVRYGFNGYGEEVEIKVTSRGHADYDPHSDI